MTGTDANIYATTEGSQPYGIAFQSLAKAALGNGVRGRGITSTSLKVSEKAAGANNSVDVAAGTCVINGVPYTETAKVNIAVSNSHATLYRRDLVVYDQSAGTAAVVAGTASATADPPNVADTNDIPLAILYVEPKTVHSTATITNSDIFDIRGFSNWPYCTASDNLMISNDTVQTGTLATFEKLKEIKVTDSFYQVRVKFDMGALGGETVTARIYVNGTGVGSYQTCSTTAYVTKTEDLTLNLAPNDLLQIYGKRVADDPATSVLVKNFRIYGTYEWFTATNQDP